VNGLLAVNSAFLQAHRPAVIGVVRAAIEATNALNQDRGKYIEVAIKGTGSSLDVWSRGIPRASSTIISMPRRPKRS
jgi:ABC-type nitrate/sulfonate/bicarbonate transport system substrate-binding protein